MMCWWWICFLLLAKNNGHSSFILYYFVSPDIIIIILIIYAKADIGNIGALSIGGALFVLPSYQLYSDYISINNKLSVKQLVSALFLK